jgi:NAD(P)-dependent dehydrogenase (short-subunit alcohol dehydrogenase family)
MQKNTFGDTAHIIEHAHWQVKRPIPIRQPNRDDLLLYNGKRIKSRAGEGFMNNNFLKGKAAIVTGSRRGMGRAIAVALARAGVDIAVCDLVREDGNLEKVAAEVRSLGSKSIAIQVDVSRKTDVGKMVQLAMAQFEKIDILVNCAGVWIPGQTLLECSQKNWDKVLNTNLKSTFYCCQAAGRIMVKQKSGNIINMSSQVGLDPGIGVGAYSISKAAIIMLTRQLALELAKYNIRVNALAPGIVQTDFNTGVWQDPVVRARVTGAVPMGRLAVPEDVAEVAVFLASEASRYMTGEVLAVNGGWRPPVRPDL